MDFPILGVDFLKHHSLMVDPAHNGLVSVQGDRYPTLERPSLPTASVMTGLHKQHQHSPSTFTPPSMPAVGYTDLIAEFPEVVDASKRLPAVNHDVVHHIVTTGPPIAAKFCKLDGEKLAQQQRQSSSNCKRMELFRGQFHLGPALFT